MTNVKFITCVISLTIKLTNEYELDSFCRIQYENNEFIFLSFSIVHTDAPFLSESVVCAHKKFRMNALRLLLLKQV